MVGANSSFAGKKADEAWTEKHRNVTRKLVVEGGWVSDEKKKCRGCCKEGTEKHRLYHCPSWREVRNQIPEDLEKWEQRAKTSKKDWRWQRGVELFAPAPAVSCPAPAPVVELVASAPAVPCAAPAPVVEFVDPTPAASCAVPTPVDVFVAPAPAVAHAALAPVVESVVRALAVAYATLDPWSRALLQRP